MNKHPKLREIIRFGIVGLLATLIQFVVYQLLCPVLAPFLANTIAYLISFTFNFFATTHYTFRVKSSFQNGVRFALCHIINFFLQSATLALFLHLGLDKQTAIIPMFAVCVPLNFLLVRKVFHSVD